MAPKKKQEKWVPKSKEEWVQERKEAEQAAKKNPTGAAYLRVAKARQHLGRWARAQEAADYGLAAWMPHEDKSIKQELRKIQKEPRPVPRGRLN